MMQSLLLKLKWKLTPSFGGLLKLWEISWEPYVRCLRIWTEQLITSTQQTSISQLVKGRGGTLNLQPAANYHQDMKMLKLQVENASTWRLTILSLFGMPLSIHCLVAWKRGSFLKASTRPKFLGTIQEMHHKAALDFHRQTKRQNKLGQEQRCHFIVNQC